MSIACYMLFVLHLCECGLCGCELFRSCICYLIEYMICFMNVDWFLDTFV